MRRKVNITGISGGIGRCLASALAGDYQLHGYDLRPLHDSNVPVTLGDLRNQAKLERAFEGTDTVIHLAGDPSPQASWESVLPHNIEGTYHVFEAARIAGVRRIVFASSNHVSGILTHGGRKIDTCTPVAPGNLYGVSKVFGEALGRQYSHAHGLSVLCVRIGWFIDADHLLAHMRARGGINDSLGMWLSENDCARLFRACIEAGDKRFGIYYGTSANTGSLWDLSNAREDLGYEPADDIATHLQKHPELAAGFGKSDAANR